MGAVKDGGILSVLDTLVDEINAVETAKSAAAKSAADPLGVATYKSDPGGMDGPSTHPSARADGNTQPARFGSRGRENTADVEKLIPNDVDNSPLATKSDSDNSQIQIGVRKSPTGEDPSVERAFKSHLDDPGTSSPATIDGGEKYSSVSFPALYKEACSQIDGLLTRLSADETFKTAAAPADLRVAADAGAALASAVLGEDADSIKYAAAQELVAAALQEGCRRADLVGQYLWKRADAENAAAADPSALPPEMGGAPGSASPPPDMGAAAGGMGGPDGSMAGPPPGPDGGMGGMPPGGAEGPGPGGPGGPGGGADGESVNELANALVDAGYPVDELISALQQAEGGAGQGGEPQGGEKSGAARLPVNDRMLLFKLASDVLAAERGGKFRRVRREQLGKEAANMRDECRQYLNYIREVCAR